ncbi:MAG: Unknown protein [uncultured Sulfurovum sp.]|uniref:Glucosamine inositolphosphorylceramide transferase 1 N-terminal domain-containing protein n=1 Tax=uncultured Sulfurovum sp. TaxID=269237 RepID=A0A6S6T459_9BACT|nr:MAG: Unknown protein [uncultured Sulfurovum sp.]
MKKKIKIGLLINTYNLPIWEYIIIRKLMNSHHSDIKLIIKNDTRNNKKLLKKIKNHWKHFVYLLYIKLDKQIFKLKNSPSELKDSKNLLKKITEIKVEPVSTKFSDKFKKKDIDDIKSHDLDILIRFGFGILRGEILKSSKYGVWSYHHGDNSINRGGPAGFWEVIEGIGTTGSILQILTEDLDAGKILYKSSSKTDEFSINRNKHNYYWKSLSFLPRKIEELYNIGEDAFFKKVDYENRYPTFYSNRLYSKDNFCNIKMSILFLHNILKMLYKKIYIKIFLEQWILLFSLENGLSTSFWRFKKIIPPKDRFYADPFIVKRDETYYIFIEEALYSTEKGHISVIEMNSKGEYKPPVTIIDKPYHLSYPHIIELADKYFMIPESNKNKTIELYECINFPYEWEFKMNLMEEVTAVDSTLFFYNDKWWLFCNMIEHPEASLNDELYLFYADKLETTEWVAHPMNPIISDVTKSRPAGNIFMHKDKIIRPSQNSTSKYGYGMTMNEIVTLNEKEYAEVKFSSIEPNWNKKILRTHTFNHTGNLTIIDGRFKRKRTLL